MSQDYIRIDDLLARDVRVQWFEGVALLQAVCRHLLRVNPSARDFPRLSNMQLGADGSVSTLAGSGGGGIAGAAHALAQMLSDDAPVRLRLVVAQGTGAENGYTTLAEFSEALAYFERPDGRSILRQLHERTAVASSRPPATPPPVEAAPAVHNEQAPSSRRDDARPHRSAVLVAALALLACIAVWVVAFGFGDGRISAAVAVVKGLTGGTAPQDEATEASAEPSRNSSSNTRRTAAGGPKATGASTEPHTGESISRVDANRGTVVGAENSHATVLTLAPLSVFRQSSATSALERLDVRVTDNIAGVPVFGDPEPLIVIATTDENEGGPDGPIFSREDFDVTPPRSTYPKLPPDSTTGRDSKGRTVLELIVATNGLVERVRLMTPPRDVHEFMLVSAAKAWRFEPATMAGRPVRFLHRISITGR